MAHIDYSLPVYGALAGKRIKIGDFGFRAYATQSHIVDYAVLVLDGKEISLSHNVPEWLKPFANAAAFNENSARKLPDALANMLQRRWYAEHPELTERERKEMSALMPMI